MVETEEQSKKVYTVDDIMEILSITRRTVHNWIKTGRMKAVRIGRQLRIPIEFYEDFMKNNLVDNSSKKGTN